MGSRFEESIYQMLSREPVTPNEVAKKLGIAQKTAQRILMHLALTGEDAKYRTQAEYTFFERRRRVN